MDLQENEKNKQSFISKLISWLRFGGEFANENEEIFFQETNWDDISKHTQYVLTIGVAILSLFGFLEWFSGGYNGNELLLATAIVPIVTAFIVLIALLKMQVLTNYIPLLLFLLAFANSVSNTYVIMSSLAVWSFYLIVILGQILFFAVFVPNRFKYTLASVVVLVVSYIYVGEILIGDILLSESSLLSIAVGLVSLVYKFHLNKRVRHYYEEERKLKNMFLEADFSREVYENNAAANINLMDQLAIAEQEAKQNSQFLKAVLDHIHQGIIVYDRNYRLVGWNQPFEKLMDMPEGFLKVGMPQDEVLLFNANRGEYGDGDPDEQVRLKLKQIQANKGQENFIYDRRRPNGQIMNIIGTSLPDGGIISSYIDVTNEREREEEVRIRSLRDVLTDLSNRRAFEADMNSAIRSSDKDDKSFVLAMVDLDNFKPVNDTYGHPVGDQVLRDVADILRSHIRGTDSASRIGGDEFAIVFRGVADINMIKERVTSIIRAIAKITIQGCDDMKLGASVGLAQYKIHGSTCEMLIENSDKALYMAKDAGKNTVVISIEKNA
jgi:diguanylate cyclase (GGDEF)-like protein